MTYRLLPYSLIFVAGLGLSSCQSGPNTSSQPDTTLTYQDLMDQMEARKPKGAQDGDTLWISPNRQFAKVYEESETGWGVRLVPYSFDPKRSPLTEDQEMNTREMEAATGFLSKVRRVLENGNPFIDRKIKDNIEEMSCEGLVRDYGHEGLRRLNEQGWITDKKLRECFNK